MGRFRMLTCAIALSLSGLVASQPSPAVQKRISAAIKNAAHQTNLDYTAFVNPFIGTGMSRSYELLTRHYIQRIC